MTLNIEGLVALADRLDKAGKHDEADKIDQMVKKLAAEKTMEEYMKEYEERQRAEQAAGITQEPTSSKQKPEKEEKVEKIDRSQYILPPREHDEPDYVPYKEIKKQEKELKQKQREDAARGIGNIMLQQENSIPGSFKQMMDQEGFNNVVSSIDWTAKNPGQNAINLIESMRKAGMEIFFPGELETWLSDKGYVKVNELELLSDEDFKEVESSIRHRMNKRADSMGLQEHVPGAFDLSSSDRVLPVEIKKDLETFFTNPTEGLEETIVSKLQEYMAQRNQEEQKPISDEDAASEIERIEREKGVVWSAKKQVFEKLAKIADRLDAVGSTEEAGLIDGFIQKHVDEMKKQATDVERKEEADTEQSKRYDSKYHHSLQIREPKTDQERIDREGRDSHHKHTYQPTGTVSLSTRYCPDHVGVMMSRVGENTYQCPLDGQTYNWETGWTDYEGNEHPGGSVAGQTPDSSNIATPHRIFDSRENILNRIN